MKPIIWITGGHLCIVDDSSSSRSQMFSSDGIYQQTKWHIPIQKCTFVCVPKVLIYYVCKQNNAYEKNTYID